MREHLETIQSALLWAWQVLRKQLEIAGPWVQRQWAAIHRSCPWLGRHRVMAISVLNAIAIVSFSCLIAGISMKPQKAEAVAHKPRSEAPGVETTTGASSQERDGSRSSRSQRKTSTASTKLGQRDYDVEVRRPGQSSRRADGAAAERAERSVIEQSDDGDDSAGAQE